MVPQKEHAKRRGRLERDDRRLLNLTAFHGDLENVIRSQLNGGRRLPHSVSDPRTQVLPHLLGRGDVIAHPLRAVLLKGPDHGRIEKLASLHSEFEALGANSSDKVFLAGHETQTRADRAVFVEPGGTDIDAKLEHTWLVEGRGADACAA